MWGPRLATLVAAMLWGGCLGVALVAVNAHLAVTSSPGEWRLILAVVILAHLMLATLGAWLGAGARARWAVASLPAILLAVVWIPGLGGDAVTPAVPPKVGEHLPHLVLISTDGLGSTSPTPQLHALAAEGVAWSQCLSTTPLASSAHASMLTGKHTWDHRVDDARPLDEPSVVRILRRRGYRTAAFLSSHEVDRRTGLQRDFHHWEDRWGWGQCWGWSPVLRLLGPGPRPGVRPGAETVSRALAWAGQVAGPRFMWIHLHDAPPVADALVGEVVAGLAGEWAWVVVGAHGPETGEAWQRVPLVVGGPWIRPRRDPTPTTVRRVKDVLLALSARQTPASLGDPVGTRAVTAP